jgi:polysaccharide export outer membrane protein
MKLIIKILFATIFLSSCTVNSHVMLKTKNDYVFDTINHDINPEYKIAPNDIIDFRLYTNDGFEVIDMVSQSNSNRVLLSQSNIIQYNIRKDSLVELPIIGEVNLVGKTIIESEKILEKKYANFYVDPFINLRVKSKRVVIFPGTGSEAKVVPLKYNNTTLIEALASVGGISSNGKAKKIKLIRKTDKKQEVFLINLSTINGLRDASMILQSNDIIYVEPVRNYAREILSDITPVLGLISTATSLWATYLIIANQ